MQWRREAAEAVAYIHGKGVIHSDLRPDNFLLYETAEGSKSLRLCDFGGSVHGKMNGGHLPDAGFFDPRKPWVSTKQTDIFSLGSVFYTVMVGYWPYRSRGSFIGEEYEQYIRKVDLLFSDSKFPAVDHLHGAAIIQGCWYDQFKEAADIVIAHG